MYISRHRVTLPHEGRALFVQGITLAACLTAGVAKMSSLLAANRLRGSTPGFLFRFIRLDYP